MKKLLLFLSFATFLMAGVMEDWLDAMENNDSSTAIFLKKCDEKDMGSCETLGDIYYEKGYTAKSAYYMQKACEGGKMRSCFNLGWLYNVGDGVEHNWEKAVLLWEKACDNGFEESCEFLRNIN